MMIASAQFILVASAALSGLVVFVVNLFACPGFQAGQRHANDVLAHLEYGCLLLVVLIGVAESKEMSPLLGKQCHPCNRNGYSQATACLLAVLQVVDSVIWNLEGR